MKLGYGIQLKVIREVRREAEWGQTANCSNTIKERTKNVGVFLMQVLKRKETITTGTAVL